MCVSQDETLNELLPFGEYRPPEQTTPSHVLLGLEAWELDRLLARIAVHGNSAGGRRSRAQRQAARASRAAAVHAAAESGNISEILSGGRAGSSGGAGGGATAVRSEHGTASGSGEASSPPMAMGRDGSGGAHAGDSAGVNGAANCGDAYPASWPPASHRRHYSRVGLVTGVVLVVSPLLQGTSSPGAGCACP